MKLKMSVKKGKTKDLEKVLKHIRTIHDLTIDAGYFESQGIHDDSKVPYSVLMAWHEYGMGNYPARPVLNTTASIIESSAKNKGFKQFVTGLVSEVGGVKRNSEQLGKRMQLVGQSIFGDLGFLTSNTASVIESKGFNAPLIDSGDLIQHFAYRTSLDESIKT